MGPHLAALLVDRKADYLAAYWAVQTALLKADYWVEQKDGSTVALWVDPTVASWGYCSAAQMARQTAAQMVLP